MTFMRKRWKSCAAVMIAAAAFILSTFLLHTALAAEGRTVRVAYYPLENYHSEDSKGNVVGYEVDYLDSIAEYTGWTYEFVKADSWVEAMQMLREGKVDLLSPSHIMEDRLEEFGFSSIPIGKVYGAIITLDVNEDMLYEDFEQLSEMTFGIENGVSYAELLEEYANDNHFTLKKVKTYKNHDALVEALNSGKVDAIVANIMRIEDNMKLLGKFGTASYYFMFRKEDVALERELNEALYRIDLETPAYQDELINRYFPIYSTENLTKEEHDFVSSLRELRIGCPVDIDPISYVNPDNREVAGVTRDLLDLVAEKTGLKFRYVALPSGDVTYDLLREKEIDLVACIERNGTNANAPGVHLTTPYFSSQKVVVGKRGVVYDKTANLRVAVSTSSQTLIGILEASYPNFTVERFPDDLSCMRAIKKGKADVMIQNQYVVQPYLAKPQFSDLAVIPSAGIPDELCLSPLIYKEKSGVLDPVLSDKRFFSVLNKGIANLTTNEVSSIIIAHTTDRPYPFVLGDFIYEYRYAIAILLLVLVCAAIIAVYAVSLKKRNFEILKKSEDKLRNITNNINGGVVVLLPGEGMKITYANEGFLDLIQCPPEDYYDVMNASYVMYIHPEDLPVLNALTEGSFQKEKQISIRLRIRRKDGKYIPTRFNGTVTKTDRGEAEMYCVIMDISQEMDMLNKLEFERKKHDHLIEKANEIIYEIDMEKKEVHVSEFFQKFMGWAPASSYGDKKMWLESWQVFPEDILNLFEMFEVTLEQLEDCNCNVRLKRSDGAYHWCAISQYVMRDEQNQVKLILGKITDIDEEIKEKKLLEKKSQTDEMTGLYNKETFIKLASRYLEETCDPQTAVIFMDLDQFKSVNDEMGHIMGDTAIKDAAKKLRVIFSSYDILARFGGDEFCVLVKEIPQKTLEDKIRWALEKLCATYSDKGRSVTVTASIGIAWAADVGFDLDTLLRCADKALYDVKEQGKNNYQIYGREKV